MSLTVDQREEGKFSLAVKAEFLASHTLEITANENVFLPEYRKGLTDECYRDWKNHAAKGNSKQLLQRMDEYYRSLWKDGDGSDGKDC